MVQEYYSLEEAARALGVGTQELKQMVLKHPPEVRAFADRGTWKFRKQDIEEFARRRGAGSSAEIPLANVKPEGDLIDFDVADLGLESSIRPSPGSSSGSRSGSEEEGADQILLSNESMAGGGGPRMGASTIIGMGSQDKPASDSDVRLVPGGSSVTEAPGAASSKAPSDSDVRLVPGGSSVASGLDTGSPKSPSDSAVKLVGQAAKRPSDSDVKLVETPSREAKRSAGGGPADTKVGLNQPAAAKDQAKTESDFELGPGQTPLPSGAGPAHGEEPEIFLGSPSDSDITSTLASASGINLGSPADSGISLESPPDAGVLGSDVGLSPLEESKIAPAKKPPTVAKPAKPATGIRPEAKAPGASDSGKDIFETDFEVPVIEDTDETMHLDPAASDFEVSTPQQEASSASQVFALDEDAEEVDPASATALGSGIATVDEEEGVGASGFGSSASGILEQDLEEEPATSSAAIPAAGGGLVTTRAEAEWGGLWVGLLAFTTILTMLIAFIMFDLVHNMWTWNGHYPIAGGLIEQLRGLFHL